MIHHSLGVAMTRTDRIEKLSEKQRIAMPSYSAEDCRDRVPWRACANTRWIMASELCNQKERDFKKCRMYGLRQNTIVGKNLLCAAVGKSLSQAALPETSASFNRALGTVPCSSTTSADVEASKAATTTLLQTHSFDRPFTFKGIFATCPNKRNPLDHSICSAVSVLQTQGNKKALKKPKGKLFSTTPLMELILFMWQTHLLLRHWCHILHNADVHHPRLCHINILLKSIAVLHFQTAIQ